MAKEYRVLDLFCGAGGLSWGLHKNPNFKTLVALDFDAKAAETFRRNMPDTEVIVGDITDYEIKNRIISLSKKEGVNMIVGGPPCQGYSMKGKKLGLNDPRNFLFREYLNIVEQLKPDVFVIENVKGLLVSSNGWFKDEIVQSIRKLGYTVRFGLLNAADFGVPQARERAIFICSKDKAIELPKPTVNEHVTVRDAISDLAYLNSGEGQFEQDYITEPQSNYQAEMRKGSQKLYNHKASKHKEIAIEKLKLIPPEQGKEYLPDDMIGNQKFKTTWGRLKWDIVSPTIDTRFDASSNGTNNHPFLHRAIAPREAARIQ
jgi:DNA (cytosine-5)-methyltransferase 1/site-specific DNA-methyltransferase (adenine-specific)